MDEEMRTLCRRAEGGDEVAAAELERRLVRSGLPGEAAARLFARVLTRDGALWIAGAAALSEVAREALGEAIRAVAPGLDAEGQAKVHRAARDRALELCRERARREWTPLPALGVLASRTGVRTALGLDRMPAGAMAEERRVRQARRREVEEDLLHQCCVLSGRSLPWTRGPADMGWQRLVDLARSARGEASPDGRTGL